MKSQTEHPTTAESQEAIAISTTEESFEMETSARRGLLGGIVAWIAACGSDSKRKAPSPSPVSPKGAKDPVVRKVEEYEREIDEEPPPNVADSAIEPVAAVDGSTPVPCDPYPVTGDDLASISEMPTDSVLQPSFKYYGAESSALMVLHLSRITAADVNTVASLRLVKADGRNVALHVISEADRTADGKLRPIAIENLRLVNGSTYVLVIATADGKLLKSTIAPSVNRFEVKFRNLSVRSLLPGAIPALFSANQGVVDFEVGTPITPGSGTIGKDINGLRYSADPLLQFGGRPLKTALTSITYLPSTPNKMPATAIIADLMGAELGTGSTFSDIINHPSFFCYVPATDEQGSSIFVRSFIRVG